MRAEGLILTCGGPCPATSRIASTCRRASHLHALQWRANLYDPYGIEVSWSLGGSAIDDRRRWRPGGQAWIQLHHSVPTTTQSLRLF